MSASYGKLPYVVFIERKEVIMDNYINYSFYDELGKHIVIIHKNTPQETIERYLQIYDEVKYKE